MIIECVKCNKKFEVNSSLIPQNGRTIQCGSCNHVWFFTKNIENSTIISHSKNINDNNKPIEKVDTKNESSNYQHQEQKMHDNVISDNRSNKKKTLEKTKTRKTSSTLGKFLSYILVFLISSIALIIILDTFKSPISDFYPEIEIVLYNFFETIKDIYLFLKNLFI